jgi:uncharacterized membrane protein
MSWSEQRVQRVMAGVLRWGVILSSLVVLAGAAGYLARYGHAVPRHGVFHGEPSALRNIGGILREALSGGSRGIIEFGLLLLVATPVARVALAVYGFARRRDWKFVIISSIVLTVLLYSLVFAR